MSLAGVRSSSTFETQFSSAIKDRKLEGSEYKQLKTEFERLNPGADFDGFLKDRLQNKVDLDALKRLGSGSSKTHVMLEFPIMDQSRRVDISGKVSLSLTDSNGFGNEGRDDLTGKLSGSINLGVVIDTPIGKVDFQDVRNAGFDIDAQGRLSMSTNSWAGWAEWIASPLVDARAKVTEAFKAAGIDVQLREENGRVILEPKQMKLTGQQLQSMGVQTPISPQAELSIDLSKARLSFVDGQLKLDLNDTPLIGSSNAASQVDGRNSSPNQAEQVNVDLAGNATLVTAADSAGREQFKVEANQVEARLSLDIKTLQAIQTRLKNENPETGELHRQLRQAGVSNDVLTQVRTGSEDILKRLLKDPTSKIDIILKVKTLDLQTQQFGDSISPEYLDLLKQRLDSEDPQSGPTHQALREAGVSDDFLQKIRSGTPASLQSLLRPDPKDLQAVTRLNRNLDRLREAMEAGIIPTGAATTVNAQGLSATGTIRDGQGQETGQLSLDVSLLTARLLQQRTDLDAKGIQGKASGTLTLSKEDLEQVKAKLEEYKTWIQDRLKDLGLSSEAFNQLLQMGSADNLKALLSSATPQKISELAQKLGISKEQTRKLVDFLNTDTFKQTTDDIFKLTKVLGENTRVTGQAQFSLAQLGWTNEDQNQLKVLQGLSVSASVQATAPDQSQAQVTVGAKTDKITQEGPPGQTKTETAPVTVTAETSGDVYANPGQVMSEEKQVKALEQRRLNDFYQGALIAARQHEQKTGVPASVILAAVVSDYQQTPKAQRAQFKVAEAMERQTQQLVEKFPVAIEAFRKEGKVKAFTDAAKGLRLPNLKPELIKLAHAKETTQVGAEVSTAGVKQDDHGDLKIGAGKFQVEQKTVNDKGKTVSQTTVSGSFGDLKLQERPEILAAIQKKLSEQYPLPLTQRSMQMHLESLGFDRSLIRSMREASPEQLKAMLQDPALKAKLSPLIQSLSAASFSLKSTNQANGQTSKVDLSAQDLTLEQGGNFSMRNLSADIVNGQLVLKAKLGKFSTNSQETQLGDLTLTAKTPSSRAKVNSESLTVANGGRVTGDVSGDFKVESQGSDATLTAGAKFEFKLKNGVATGTRIGNGMIEAEMSVSTLMEMVNQDPDAKRLLQSLQAKGWKPEAGQRIKVRLSEASLNSRGNTGDYSGTLELSNLKTSFGPTSLRLNIRGNTTAKTDTQDIWGNLSIKPDPKVLAQLLNSRVREGMELDWTKTKVTPGSNQVGIDFDHLFGDAHVTVSADGSSLTMNIDRAKLLALFDLKDAAANLALRKLRDQGINLTQKDGKLVIPVAALNVLMRDHLAEGFSIESLRYDKGTISGAFRYQR